MIAHARIPDVTLQQLAAELEREAGQRASLYPKRVEAMRMTQQEADQQLAIAAAWREDVARMIDLRTRLAEAYARQPFGPEWRAVERKPAEHKIDWRTRRFALERELELRARFYPQWIETARLQESASRHRIACLEALREIYDEGWDWPGDTTSPHWPDHFAAVEARRHPPKQESLAV